MQKRDCCENAFTGLQLVIVIVLIVIGAYGVFLFTGSGTNAGGGQGEPTGILPLATGLTGNMLAAKSPLTGFPAVDGSSSNVSYFFSAQDPGKLGGVQTTISLFIGNMGAIDMDKVVVTLVANQNPVVIPKSGDPGKVNAPGWAITSKSNWLPYQSADADNLLEPNEEFGLLIVFPQGLPPYEKFTVTVEPQQAMPLILSGTTPPRITPVMSLS